MWFLDYVYRLQKAISKLICWLSATGGGAPSSPPLPYSKTFFPTKSSEKTTERTIETIYHWNIPLFWNNALMSTPENFSSRNPYLQHANMSFIVLPNTQGILAEDQTKYKNRSVPGLPSFLRNWGLKLLLHDAIYRLRFFSNSLIYILQLSNTHNNVATIQKNRGDKSHRVVVAWRLLLT